MKNQSKTQFLLIGVLFVVALIVLGTILVIVHAKNSQEQSESDTQKAQAINSKVATHSAQDATTFTQQAYDTYLQGVKNQNTYNTAHPDGSNEPLPQAGLDAIKSSLEPALYTSFKASEQANNSDLFGCAKYLVDHYSAVLKSSSSSIATIDVSIYNSEGDNNGTIEVQVNLIDLLVSNVSCPA